ncbi:zinc finger and BTB domain-containing protein 16 [Biomphalaria glabrata]
MVFLPAGCHFQNKSFRDEEFDDISSISTNVIYPTISAKTAEGQFKIVKDLTNELNCLYQNMGKQHILVKLEQLKTFIYHIRANKEFVITNVSEALAETNISLNGGCVDAEFVPIASTSQALAETNISLNGECVGEEFVPINRAQPFVVHNSENNLSGSDIVDSSKVTTDTFSNVMLKKVKTTGRPNNKQTLHKEKKTRFPLQLDSILGDQESAVKQEIERNDCTTSNKPWTLASKLLEVSMKADNRLSPVPIIMPNSKLLGNIPVPEVPVSPVPNIMPNSKLLGNIPVPEVSVSPVPNIMPNSKLLGNIPVPEVSVSPVPIIMPNSKLLGNIPVPDVSVSPVPNIMPNSKLLGIIPVLELSVSPVPNIMPNFKLLGIIPVLESSVSQVQDIKSKKEITSEKCALTTSKKKNKNQHHPNETILGKEIPKLTCDFILVKNLSNVRYV